MCMCMYAYTYKRKVLGVRVCERICFVHTCYFSTIICS